LKKLIIALIVVSGFQAAAADAPVKSKEEIAFHTPESFKFSSVGKIPEFRGIVERVFPKSIDLQMIDLYQFKTDAVKVTQELCMQYVEKIFGLKNSKLYALKTISMEKSNKGAVCEAFISDTNKVKEDPYLRYITIGFVNAKAVALVYHPTSLNDEKTTEIRKFWENLR
jgi:hypothetical protein